MSETSLIPAEWIERRILLLRGHKVMLDLDLARLYDTPVKVLNQAVKRNAERFPEDFMFQLSSEEARLVPRSEIVTLSVANQVNPSAPKETLRSQSVTSKPGSGGRRYLPYAFTEQGVAMLSSVLRSPRAVRVNIEIMRAFVRLRQMLATNANLSRRLDELEEQYDGQFRLVFDAIRQLMKAARPPKPRPHREIGFHTLRESTLARRRGPKGPAKYRIRRFPG